MKGDDMEFASNQMWSVKGSDAKIIVGRLDGGADPIVHISVLVDGDRRDEDDIMFHVPMTVAALESSVDGLVEGKVAALEGFADGYNLWKREAGGVFTIPVQRIMELFLPLAKRTD